MDFFEAQEEARRRTRRLVGLFAAAVLAIILAIYIPAHLLAGPGPVGRFDPALFGIVAGGVLLLVGAGSGYRTLQLRRGGPAVAELLGGRRIAPETTDPEERRLVNVVEEMAIASNLPVPAIYIMDDEEGINAFAAGHSPEDAAVAVTRGTLRSLTRDELQGVIAHEFSHILNGDMRLNLRLMGLLFGILLLAVVGRLLLNVRSGPARRGGSGSGGGKRGGDGRVVLIGLVLILVGYIGVFFGRLIQAAVSRQREFLADAAAVQFTRNPAGIGGALLKIETSGEGGGAGSGVQNPHAEEAGHLFFASNLRRRALRGLATHPPLEERIRRIDPALYQQWRRRVAPGGEP
jgi:Zn-dependent protease with chaperone function